MNEKNLVKRWPIASYFILVYLISWGGVIALGLGDFLRGAELELPDVMPMAVAMLGAPTVVGITMTYITGGKDGLRDLFARMRKWKVSGRWYLALLIFPAVILAVQVPLSIWVTADLAPIFYRIGIMAGLFAGFLEETGWMGFVYPKLRNRFSVLRASIVLGLIHALWHAAADFLGNFNNVGLNWLLYFAAFFVFIVALRVIIAWIYENTQSVLMAQLAHAFSTGFLSILVPTANAGAIWPIFYPVYAVALWLVAALIIAKNRERMIEQPSELAVHSPSLQPSGN
jgi:membrane protease YdiL (CAAX protease family)